jgi:ABC-type transport system substrate-binding protein
MGGLIALRLPRDLPIASMTVSAPFLGLKETPSFWKKSLGYALSWIAPGISLKSELDPAKRKILWKTILDIAADEVPEINLFFPASGLITPKWMTGINNPERRGLITAWIEDWRAR